MRRRNLLLATATTLSVAAIAGCSGSDDTEYQEGGGPGAADGDQDDSADDDGDDGDDELPDEDEVEQREQGEDYLEFGDLVILEHEMIIEEGEFSDDITVEGVIENQDDDLYDYVEVGARVYNSDGQQLDRYWTNTTDLQGGGEWAFEIRISEDTEDVDDYDIGVQGSQR